MLLQAALRKFRSPNNPSQKLKVQYALIHGGLVTLKYPKENIQEESYRITSLPINMIVFPIPS